MSQLRFLFSLVLEHKLSYTAGAVMVGLTLWMGLTIPEYLRQAIDILSRSAGSANDEFLQRVFWILAFAIAIILTRTTSRMLFFTPGRRVEFDLKNRLLEHLTRLQRGYFLRNPTGAIISRVNNDINGIRMLMGFGLMQVCNTVFMLSLAPIRMYQISPRLTLYVTLPILLAFALLQTAIRRLRALQQRQMQAMQEISDFTVESYNGLDVLRAYRALAWAENNFAGYSENIRNVALRMSAIRAFFMPVLTHVVNLLKVLLVLVGGAMVVQAELSMGDFMAYMLYLTMLLPPLMGMTFMMFVLQRGITALGSLETVFGTDPGLPSVDAGAQRRLAPRLQQGLQINGLYYAYPDDPGHWLLRDISLSVAPGEIVGVFGSIGSGKTTLVNLINRYLQAPQGAIRLDGIDINQLSQAQLRNHVVTVSQEPFLFSASIRENVRFAQGSADDTQIAAALADASMEEDLRRFPAGQDTIAGEKGVNLSGGQKQRIALARSLLRPCDLMILDDVLSAVDHETERYLIDRIYSFQHARSLLIVSHRISVLEKADRIIVLEDGAIVAQGSHQALIQRNNLYRDAYLMQQEQER